MNLHESKTSTSPQITSHTSSHNSDVSSNSDTFAKLYPTSPSSSNVYANFKILPNASESTNGINLRLIRTLDLAVKVDEAMSKDGVKKIESSYQVILDYAKDIIATTEIPMVVKQLALLEVMSTHDKPATTIAKHLKQLDTSNTYSIYADHIAEYLSSRPIHAENKLPINESGLVTRAQNTFCPMPQDRHTEMRAFNQILTAYAGREITGKPYANYLDPGTEQGKSVFPPIDDQPFVSDEAYDHIFKNDPNFIFHVALAIQRDSLKSYQKVMRDDPTLLSRDLDSKEFADVKPNLVYTATAEETDLYIAKCTFPNGEWHVELPATVLEQMEYSKKHDINDSDTLQKFIFVQEMGTGNMLLSTHLDKTFHHSTKLAGSPVATAGELDGKLYQKEGKYFLNIKTYVNNSGHYHPSLQSMALFIDTLKESGLDPLKVNFEAMTRDKVTEDMVSNWNQNLPVEKFPPGFNEPKYSKEIKKEVAAIQALLETKPEKPEIKSSLSMPDIPSLELNKSGL